MMKFINKLFKRTDMTKSSLDKDSNNGVTFDLIEKRNLAQFGDPQGASTEQLHALGKSWQQITESACRVAREDMDLFPEKMNQLKAHYDVSKCVFYILFEECDSDLSYIKMLYACIKAKYPIVGVDGLRVLSDEHLVIVKLNEYSLSLDWHYAIGFTLRAENPESNDIVTEIVHYIAEELAKIKRAKENNK